MNMKNTCATVLAFSLTILTASIMYSLELSKNKEIKCVCECVQLSPETESF